MQSRTLWTLLASLLALAAFAAPLAFGAEGTALKAQEAKMFAAAAGYEQFMGRWSRLLAPGFIAFAGVREGTRTLDIGTGTGSLAIALAAALPQGEVVGLDPSPAFVAFAAQRTPSARVRFEVGDGQAIAYPDASFDQSLSLLVMNFIPDHRKALDQMIRVTRPGGSVAACVWDYDAGMKMLRLFWDEAVALDPAIEPKDERHMKLSRAGQLAALWKEAGLVEVVERPLAIEQSFASFDDYWGPFTKGAGPGGAYVVSLPDDRRAALTARLRNRMLGGRADGSFTLSATAWCVRGTVAAR